MRRISLLCVIAIFLCSLVCTVNAVSVSDTFDPDESITEEERLFLQEKLMEYEYGDENFSAELLYDSNENPGYLLGITANGYVIFERDSHQFQECGEGTNPYSSYMECQKYYGGPVCYFVKLPEETQESVAGSGEYFDIARKTYCCSVPVMKRQFVDESAEQQSADNVAANATVTSTIRLPNSYSFIRRKAFGYNNDNTCSAVATGIAFNYIAQQNNMAVISKEYVPEDFDNGLPRDDGIATIYPKAHALHRYIADTLGMGPVSFSSNITAPIEIHSFFYLPRCYHFAAESTPLPKASTIQQNIRAGKPVLVTTTFAGDYSWHTMCVYGYRTTSDGTQLLVHTGWYDKDYVTKFSGDKYCQNEVWVDESIATFGYYFSYDNPLENFTDIPAFTGWAYQGILYVVDKGIMLGTSNTTFSPDQTMTRSMLVSTLYRMAGSPAVTYTDIFSDVSASSGYAKAVIWASQNGIVSGVGDGKFNPHGVVTREQIATFLYRYANYCGYDTSNRASLTGFSDYQSVSNYAKTPMSWAVAVGIMQGISGGGSLFLSPQGSVTRAQAASFLMRFLENVAS